jgi:hypothetical protein
MDDLDWRLADKLIAVSLWLNRAMAKYRDIPGYDLMCASGNRAMAEASLAIRDANRLMSLKIDGQKTECKKQETYPIKSSED